MILALLLVLSVGGLIIATINLIAACIVAVIQGMFEGMINGLNAYHLERRAERQAEEMWRRKNGK